LTQASSNTTEPKARPRRRFIRLRILFYTFLLLVAIATCAYTYLTDSARVAQMASDTLSRMTGADVRIGGAAFELNGVIRLFDIELTIPDVPGSPVSGNRLFTADQILIHHNIWALATGGLDVESVSLIRPTFFPTEDIDHQKFTFQYLKPRTKPKKIEKSRSIDLPDIHLSQALVVFGEITDGKYHALQTAQLDGDLTRQPKETGIYSFALRQSRGERPFLLSGDFDLYHETMTARMQLGALSQTDPRIDMLPRQVRTLFQTIQPTGNFPSIQFGYDKERQFNALVEINDAGVNIPWGETNLHIEHTRGSVTIEQNNRLTIDLKGRARGTNYGADYEIQGTVDGFEEDAGFALTARLRGEIPEKLDDLHLFPAAVRSIIERVSPKGGFDVSLNFERDAASGTLLTHGQALVINGALTYSMFAYPMQQLNGIVTFDNDRIDIGPITGRGPLDEQGRQASVTIQGYVIGGGPRPGVHVSVTSEGAPVDHFLREALDPKNDQQIYDMFLGEKQLGRAFDEETGYLQTSKQKKERLAQLEQLNRNKRDLDSSAPRDDEALAKLDAAIARLAALSERKVFDLGGIAKAQVDVRTIPGQRGQSLTIRAQSPGLNIAYEHWPYPLTVTGGELQINLPAVNGEVVRVVGIARGLDGGEVEVNGIMRPPLERGRPLIPDIKLTAKKLPIDRALLTSIPASDAKFIEQMAVQGAIDVEGHVFNDEQHKLDFKIDVVLADGKAQPNLGNYPLTDVAAKLTIHKRGVDIHRIDAQHDASKLSIIGTPAADGRSMTLALQGQKMTFSKHLLDLIPDGEPAKKQIQILLEEYKPEGIFGFTLDDLRKTDGKTHYRFRLEPDALGIVLNKQVIAMKKMTGSLLVTPKQVHFDNLRGDFGTGQFRLDGDIATGASPAYALNFDIAADSYCKVTQSVLPRGAAQAIESLKLEGAYRIRDAKLTIDPAAIGKPAMRFDATVVLEDSKAMVGVPITQMSGEVKISLAEQKPGDLPSLELLLDGVRLRAADRWIDPLTVRIVSGNKPGMYDITKLSGNIYGGTVTGKGMLFRQNDADHYKMEIALQEVALEPFIDPTNPKHEPTDRKASTEIRLIGDQAAQGGNEQQPKPRSQPMVRPQSGMLSASLAIEGASSDANSKRGRGDLRIHDAAIYKTQLGITLLELLNLSAPASKSFDKVEATYLIDGDLVHLDRISFEAPTLTLSGKGTMKYSTLGLDLTMTSANPRGFELGPVTDVLRLLKDELVSIKVTGTLTAPKANVQSFKGITGVVDEVIGKPKEIRRILPPVRETEGR